MTEADDLLEQVKAQVQADNQAYDINEEEKEQISEENSEQMKMSERTPSELNPRDEDEEDGESSGEENENVFYKSKELIVSRRLKQL